MLRITSRQKICGSIYILQEPHLFLHEKYTPTSPTKLRVTSFFEWYGDVTEQVPYKKSNSCSPPLPTHTTPILNKSDNQGEKTHPRGRFYCAIPFLSPPSHSPWFHNKKDDRRELFFSLSYLRQNLINNMFSCHPSHLKNKNITSNITSKVLCLGVGC